jgi:N-acetylglucosamine-6-phosphate deacetylase
MGMDHMVRTFLRVTTVPLVDVVRMATLTPATIAGWEQAIGSIVVGKKADVVVLNANLEVRQVYVEGKQVV